VTKEGYTEGPASSKDPCAIHLNFRTTNLSCCPYRNNARDNKDSQFSNSSFPRNWPVHKWASLAHLEGVIIEAEADV